MKIALLLSGEVRDLSDNFTNLKSNLLDLYNIDLFLSVWSFDGIDDVIKKLNPLNFEVENYEMYSTIFNDMVQSYLSKSEINTKLNNCLSMWYKSKRVNELKKNYESLMGVRYDVVIKSRPDLRFDEPAEIKIPKNNTVYIPKGWDWSGGINDLLSYSDSQTMDTYCSLYDFYFEILKKSDRKLNAELILKRYLNLHTDLNIERPELNLSLKNTKIKSTYYFTK
jgi:hypothetical protein